MSLASNIITTLVARVGILVCSLISSIVLARMLGPEGRGLFALILLLPEMATTFGLIGFDQTNVVYAGLEPENRRALVWQSAGLAVVIGVLLTAGMLAYIVVGSPGFPALNEAPRKLFILLVSIIPIMMVIELWIPILRGMNYIFLTNTVEIGTKVFSLFILILFLVWLRLGVAGAVLTNVVMALGTFVLAAVLLKRVEVLGKPSFDRLLWRRTVQFALPAYFGTILAYMNYRIDQLIVALFLPAEQLGYYVLAVALAERLWILTSSVGNALLPHIANSPERDLEISAVVTRHVVMWTGTGCLIVFLLGDVIIRLLYSSAFAEAVTPLRWLLPGILVSTIGKNLGAELLVRKMIRWVVWMAGIAAAINLAGNLLLVPRMGISGAALASTVSYSVLALMQTWSYVRVTGVSWTTLIPRYSDLEGYYGAWCYILVALGVRKSLLTGQRQASD